MFEAYSVAVRIRLIDGVSAGLLGLSRHFGRANMEASLLQKRLDGIKRTMLVGGLMAGAGVGILAMFRPALEQAKQFEIQSAKFAQFGLGDAMVLQAAKFAKGAQIVGSSSVDTFRYINEAQGIFKESGLSSPAEQFRGAQMAAPMLAKIHFAERALGKPESSEADDRSFLRTVEMLGGVRNPASFNEIADRVFKLKMSSGGTVNSELMRQFVAVGGIAVKGMTNAALFGESEPLIAELKQRAGTGLSTAFSTISGILKPPQQRIGAFREFGLWDPKKYTLNALGGLKSMSGMPLMHQDEYQADPYRWYEKYIRPQYDRKGFTQAQRDFENKMMFGRTGGDVFSLVDRQWGTAAQPGVMQLAAIAQDKALGVNQMTGVAGKTLSGKEIDLTARFNSLLVQTGQVALPLAVAALSAILPPLRAISSWADLHPKIFAGVINGLLGLGVVLTVGGIATSLVAAAGAFRLLGLTLGGPLVGLAIRAIPIIAAGMESLAVAIAGVGLLPLLGIAAGIVAIGAAVAGIAWLATQKGPPKPFKLGNLSMPGLSFPGDKHPAYVPQHGRPKLTVNVHNKIDRHGLTTAVMGGIARMADSTQLTAGYHDQTMSPIVPGLAGNFK